MLPMMLGRSIANQRLTRVHVNIYFFYPANRDCSGSRHFDQCLAFSFSLTMTSCCIVIYFKSSIFKFIVLHALC